jgi:hypothetical protein
LSPVAMPVSWVAAGSRGAGTTVVVAAPVLEDRYRCYLAPILI